MFANKPQSRGILPKDILLVWTSNLGIAYVIGAKGVS
jgi:hypothetical protein